MQKKLIRLLLAAALVAVVWASLAAIDAVLDSSSDTYHELTEEIDKRDIDTGNAMNVFGDDASSDAVFEATQTTEHPPGEGDKQ